METTFRQDFIRGIRIGTGILTAIAVGWAGVSFAAAAWGALPTASSWSVLSASAWNDVVWQMNTIAGAMTVDSGKVGIWTWTPETALDVKVSDASNSIRIVNDSSTGLRYPWVWAVSYIGSQPGGHPYFYLLNSNGSMAAPAPLAAWRALGAIVFMGQTWTTSTDTAQGARIDVSSEAAFWTNSSPSRMTFSTAGATGAYAGRMVITSSGSVGIGTNTPQSTLQVTGNYLQIPNYSGAAPLASDCDQASEAGRMAIYTPNTGAPATSYLYVCPQGGGWVAK